MDDLNRTLYPNQTIYTKADINEAFIDAVLPVSIIFGVFTLVGILGNLFVLYVHIFRYQRCNFRCFVLGLCAVDLMSSLTILPLEIYFQMNWFVFRHEWLCKSKSFLHVFLSVGSVYVLLLISVDRYRKVCRPYGWQMTPVLVMKAYGFCFFLAACQAWTVVMVFGLNEHLYTNFKGHNVMISECSSDPDYVDTLWPKVYTVAMMPHFIAMLAMLVIYLFVGRKIFSVYMKMRQKSKRKKQGTILRRSNNIQYPTETPNGDLQHSSTATNEMSSEGVIDSKLQAEIQATYFSKDKDVEMVAYKVQENSILFEKGSSIKRKDGNSSQKMKMTFEQKQKMDKRSSKSFLRRTFSKRIPSESLESPGTSDVKERSKSEISKSSAKESVDTDPTRASTSKSRNYSNTRSETAGDSSDLDNDVFKTEDTEEEYETLKRPAKRRKSMAAMFKKKVKFSLSRREKLKRRTLITFVFTAVFIVTTVTYIVISDRIVNETDGDHLELEELSLQLFFYRLYFINSVIHPIIYGFLDPKFRKTITRASKKVMESVLLRSHNGI